jgi:hypothetical protein
VRERAREPRPRLDLEEELRELDAGHPRLDGGPEPSEALGLVQLVERRDDESVPAPLLLDTERVVRL